MAMEICKANTSRRRKGFVILQRLTNLIVSSGCNDMVLAQPYHGAQVAHYRVTFIRFGEEFRTKGIDIHCCSSRR